MVVEWSYCRKISRTQVEYIEKQLGIKYPEDFVECVLENNYGYPLPHEFMMENGGEVFNNLISLDINHRNNILDMLDGMGEVIPSYLVPFGRDPFGNYICFDFSDNGKVVFWDHEKNYETFVETEYICETFTEFLAMLQELPDDI